MASEFRKVQAKLDGLRTDLGAEYNCFLRDQPYAYSLLKLGILIFYYSQYNTIARIENSSSRKGEYGLVCLKDTSTNELIPNFPSTASDVINLSSKYYVLTRNILY